MHSYSSIEFLCGKHGMACFAPEFVWTNSISSCCLLLFVAIAFSGNFSSRVSGFRVVFFDRVPMWRTWHGIAPEFVREEGLLLLLPPPVILFC